MEFCVLISHPCSPAISWVLLPKLVLSLVFFSFIHLIYGLMIHSLPFYLCSNKSKKRIVVKVQSYKI